MIINYIFRAFTTIILTSRAIDCTSDLTPYTAAESQFSPAFVAPNIQLLQRYSSPTPSYSSPSPAYNPNLLPYTSVQESPSYSDNTYAATESEPVSYKWVNYIKTKFSCCNSKEKTTLNLLALL